jgi:hypothetical protein
MFTYRSILTLFVNVFKLFTFFCPILHSCEIILVNYMQSSCQMCCSPYWDSPWDSSGSAWPLFRYRLVCKVHHTTFDEALFSVIKHHHMCIFPFLCDQTSSHVYLPFLCDQKSHTHTHDIVSCVQSILWFITGLSWFCIHNWYYTLRDCTIAEWMVGFLLSFLRLVAWH